MSDNRQSPIMPTDMDKLAVFPALAQGAHEPDEGIACMMEAASFLAGEPWSDTPLCVAESITTMGRRLNDAMPDHLRDPLLRPLVPLVVGTAATPQAELRRAYIAVDYAVREAVPAVLRAVGMDVFAEQLAALRPVIDEASADAAFDAMQAIPAALGGRSRQLYATIDFAINAADAISRCFIHGAVVSTTSAICDACQEVRRTMAVDSTADQVIWRGAADCLRRMCEMR